MFPASVWIILVVLFVIWYRKKVWVYPTNFPPGPRFPLPIIGDALALGKDIAPGLVELHKKHGNLVGLSLGGTAAVSISDFETIQDVLAKDEYNVRPPAPGFEMYHRKSRRTTPEGTGLVFASGETYRRIHRFTLRALKDFGFGKNSITGKIEDEVNDLIDRLEQKADRPLKIVDEFYVPVVGTLYGIIQGERIDPTNPKFLKMFQDWQEGINMAGTPIGQMATANATLMAILETFSLLKIKRMFGLFYGYFDPIIKEHQNTLVKDQPRDFIDKYLTEIYDDSTEFAKEESHSWLMACLTDLIGAGHDTSSNTLAWSMLFLANNPHVQAKVHEELDRVCGSRDPTYDDRENLPYTEATLMEIQRKGDLLPISVLHATSKDVNLQGYFIPKGTLIIPLLTMVLNNPEVFPEPSELKPERFIKDGKFVPHPHVIAFSTGKRSCLGEPLAKMVLFVFLTRILKKFQIKPAHGVLKLSEKRIYGFTVVADNFEVELKLR